MKPSSLQEAVSIIQANFSQEELREFASQSEQLARVSAHWSIGVWVRNNWIHDGSPLAAEVKNIAWFVHDDDISSYIIIALWRVLNGESCPLLKDLLPESHWSDGFE
jgi:hypothetical protein